jgi:hypothetical protein
LGFVRVNEDETGAWGAEAMLIRREIVRAAVAGSLLLIAAAYAWSDQSPASETLTWPWQPGDCYGTSGAVLQDQWVDAASGTRLCIVPPSYLCPQSSGPPLRWYVDVEIDGEMFSGTADPDIEHCVTTEESPVTVHSSTYCTTFLSRYDGSIRFEPEVRDAIVADHADHPAPR